MKKIINLILLPIFLSSCSFNGVNTFIKDTNVAEFQKEQIDDCYGLEMSLSYDKKSYSISGIGTCTEEYLEIPSTHFGLPVTSIDSFAFENSKIRRVIIPSSIKEIGTKAFCGCKNLTYFETKGSIDSIGDLILYDCSGIKEMVLYSALNSKLCKLFSSDFNKFSNYPNNYKDIVNKDGFLSICTFFQSEFYNSFYYHEGYYAYFPERFTKLEIKSGTVPNDYCGVATWGGEYGKMPLEEIILGDEVTSIEENAFANNVSLKRVVIGKKVKSIGSFAFNYCYCMTSKFILPASVTYIGHCAIAIFGDLIEDFQKHEIWFEGSKNAFNGITKEADWDSFYLNYTIGCGHDVGIVHCSDGDLHFEKIIF